MKSTKNVVVKKDCHSRMLLSGIYNACRCQKKEDSLLNRCVENPRLQTSGMTANWITAHGFTPCRHGETPRAHARGVKCGSPELVSGSSRSIKGFTLIELLVVILIIGILATVAVPQYQKSVYKVHTMNAISMLSSIIKAQEIYYLANGEYTDDITDLDIDIPANQLANGWAESDSTQPDVYMYSCRKTEGCIGQAFNQNLPMVQWNFWSRQYPEGEENHAGWLQCVKYNANETAASICASIGTLRKEVGGGIVKYYRVKL